MFPVSAIDALYARCKRAQRGVIVCGPASSQTDLAALRESVQKLSLRTGFSDLGRDPQVGCDLVRRRRRPVAALMSRYGVLISVENFAPICWDQLGGPGGVFRVCAAGQFPFRDVIVW